MPARDISLPTAKQWAKRLHADPSSPFPKLSQAQAAVAKMLGHASWHELEAFCSAPAAAPVRAVAKTTDEYFEAARAAVNRRYPNLKWTSVQAAAMGLSALNEEAADSVLENSEARYWSPDEWVEHFQETRQRVHAPPGHMWFGGHGEDGSYSWALLPMAELPSLEP